MHLNKMILYFSIRMIIYALKLQKKSSTFMMHFKKIFIFFLQKRCNKLNKTEIQITIKQNVFMRK